MATCYDDAKGERQRPGYPNHTVSCGTHDPTPTGHTALHTAARAGDVAACRYLLEQGADLHATTSRGASALHWAAEHGRVDAALTLLEAGADVNAACESFHNTPLMDAVIWNQAAAVAALLRHGADKDIADAFGMKPAERCTSRAVAQMLSG
eukprot:TRINITY_DN5126_c1_g1_i1.p1 TRINITY_DN5126_c1_g1~~TRINITY_DN5126_c1_g1_i1.p1  ORF type:complete len:152 (+),score=45.84 TRINITY_DN5126_c1_g1_i1:36-491(+)